MLHSAEIRWFVPGTPAKKVLTWFEAGEALEPEGKRIDNYLMFADCDTVGVKLRNQKKFEIKSRVSDSRPLALVGLGINGRTDQWVRWSFDSEGLTALEGELKQSGRWVQVIKDRYLRKFSADSGNVVEVPPKQEPFPDSGCNVELTLIEVQADPKLWFSLGFEAFGSSGSVAKILNDTLESFFKAHGSMPEHNLSGRESMSYPTWLATLI